ncbi:hypothetical protein F4677DRAFT_262327 [Hypoxylon crocopeplum]|nr:hypothetical protein F4677DRAFT_262327 [Hypoxylon crocopeplum]
MAPVAVSFVYPMGAKFDMEYYMKTHMPLVQEKWSKYGLKSWKVAHYTNEEATYCVQAWLEFDDLSQWGTAAASSEGTEIFDDVPNFTDAKPSTLVGVVTGGESW